VGTDHGPAISAHRGGSERAAAGTYAAYRVALDAGADYVEADARRTADGTLVCCHRARSRWGTPVADLTYQRLCRTAGYRVPLLADVLALLAGRASLQLDVKEASSAAAATQMAVTALGPDRVIVTTRDAAVARELRPPRPELRVGLAVGGDLAESFRFAIRPGLSRLDAVTTTGASWAALHYRVARAGLAAQCRERGLGTLVWTVNSDRALARWLASREVDILVTDRPARALALRARTDQALVAEPRLARTAWVIG
jgi:glycerophosphoryl diester phosphodiesterase